MPVNSFAIGMNAVSYLDQSKKIALQSGRMMSLAASTWLPWLEKAREYAVGPAAAFFQHTIDNIVKADIITREQTREPSEPRIDVPYSTVWEDDRVKLCEVLNDAPIGSPIAILFMPIMRGPYLGFYTEPDKPDKLKSVGKALMQDHGAKFRILFTDWKPLDSKTKKGTIEDYIYGTFHGISDFCRENLGASPISIDLCQPGYFDLLRLAKHPDDALMTVLVASPHGKLTEESVLYQGVKRMDLDDLEDFAESMGGAFPGRMIANNWGIATSEKFCDRYTFKDEIETAKQILEGKYDFGRAHVFQDWMLADTRDVPTKVIRKIGQIFKEDMMDQDSPMGYSQANYKNPLIVVWGKDDDVVPRKNAEAPFRYVSSAVMESYGVPGGHAAVFNGSKSIEIWCNTIIPRILELYQKQTSLAYSGLAN